MLLRDQKIADRGSRRSSQVRECAVGEHMDPIDGYMQQFTLNVLTEYYAPFLNNRFTRINNAKHIESVIVSRENRSYTSNKVSDALLDHGQFSLQHGRRFARIGNKHLSIAFTTADSNGVTGSPLQNHGPPEGALITIEFRGRLISLPCLR